MIIRGLRPYLTSQDGVFYWTCAYTRLRWKLRPLERQATQSWLVM